MIPVSEQAPALRRADGSPVRVLVVDDEPTLSELLAMALRYEGWDISTAHNGTKAVREAKEHQPDAIVLDVMLPGLNGYKVCAELRAKQVWTPVLMLTAKDGELDEAEALDTGADDFLSKPFSYVVLVARLRALLRRGGSVQPPVLQSGSIDLDVAARSCFVDGKPVELTPREFSVVEYLMRRHGEVVPKSEILEHVRDVAFDGDGNVVEVHVSALRRKLGSTAIETVRGAGYRMGARAR
jgi:DNA-binding response OmpR family regulator